MAFVISRAEQEEQEEEEEKEQSGFVISRNTEPEDTSFSFGKDILGPAKEFGMGAIDLATRAFGGGEDSPMVMDEQFKMQQRQSEYDQQAQQLQQQGLQDQQIQQQLGDRPEERSLSDLINQLTGGALSPENPRQRMFQTGAREAGEFAATEALTPGSRFLKEAAKQRMLKMGVKEAGEFVAKEVIPPISRSLKGIAKWAGLGGLFGLGEQISEEVGGEEGAKLATGLTLMSVPFLAKKGYQGVKNSIEFGRGLLKSKPLEGVPKFLSEGGTEKALADLELSSKNLTGRVAQTSENMVSKFDDLVGKVAEPSFKDVGTFRAADIEKELIKSNQNAILDTISPTSKTQKKSWEGIQSFVNENFKAAKESYTKLYESSETIASKIKSELSETAEVAQNLNKELRGSLLKTSEDKMLTGIVNKLVKSTEKTLEPKARKMLKDLGEQGIETDMEEIISFMKIMGEEGVAQKYTLDRAMKTKRAINRVLKKADIIPAPVDLLKPLSSALKRDIINGLEGSPGKALYEAAESTFAETQNVFNNDAIIKMRKSQSPEEMTSMFTKASNLQKLKKSIGGNKDVDNFIDRLVVENIAGKSKSAAQEMARESREYIGKKGQDALDKILEYGDTMTSPGQQSLSKGRVLEDLQKSFDVGARPDYTLKMMRNTTGYNLVKDTLNRSPRGKKMWKSLQRMTFEDMVASVIGKDKQIDFEKAKDIISDPHLKSVVKEALGKEGLEFFGKMEQYGKNMSKNLENFALKEKNLFEKISENYLDKGLKYALYAMAPGTLGVSTLPIIGIEIGKRAYRGRLFKVLENTKSRNILKELGGKNVSPRKMASLIKQLSQISGKPSKEEE